MTKLATKEKAARYDALQVAIKSYIAIYESNKEDAFEDMITTLKAFTK